MSWLGASNRGYYVLPLDLPLVQPTDQIFSYIGNFTVPTGTGGAGFNGGGTGMAINPSPNGGGGTMWMSALDTSGNLNYYGSVNIPTLTQIRAGGAAASTAHAPVAVLNDINSGSNNLAVCGGLYTNGSLYIVKNSYYPGPTQSSVISKCSGDMTSQGTTCSMSGDASSVFYPLKTSRYYTGQLTAIPAIWQSLFDGDTLVAMGPGNSVVSSSVCRGIGVSAFKIGDVSSAGGTVTAIDYAGWSETGGGSNSYPNWGNGTMTTAANIVASITSGVLNVTSILCSGIDLGVNSWIVSSAFPTIGQYFIKSPISVNADRTGTYQLAQATTVSGEAEGTTSATGALSGTLLKTSVIPMTVLITDGTNTWVDMNGDGNLYKGAYVSGGTQPGWQNEPGTQEGAITYSTGAFSILGGAVSAAVTASYTYYAAAYPADTPSTKMCASSTAANICPNIGSSIPYGGDNFYATYGEGIGAPIFINNSKTILIPQMICDGPHGGYVPQTSYHPCPQCSNQGGSGTNDPRRLRLYAYNAADLINNKSSQGVSAALPYAVWDFPNYIAYWPTQSSLQSSKQAAGWMCVDTVNSLLYASTRNNGAVTIHCWSIGSK